MGSHRACSWLSYRDQPYARWIIALGVSAARVPLQFNPRRVYDEAKRRDKKHHERVIAVLVARSPRRKRESVAVHHDQAIAMNTYETSATVEEQGRILVAGVPFPPGAQVDVTVSLTQRAKGEAMLRDDEALAAARDRLRELFGAIRGFRNSPRIPREDLYERGRVR
jgi:hypothetical protein